MNQHPRALITGGARRIGACIAHQLHDAGYDLVLHYRHSASQAEQLCAEFNTIRHASCTTLQADLEQMEQVEQLAAQITASGSLQLLVNNASSFYPTAIGSIRQQDWDALINSNLRGPFFLTQALSPQLRASQGAVVNLVDVHAERGLTGYPVYSIAKAGLKMMTLSLARELAPHVRVNGIAPGPILWPEAEAALNDDARQAVLDKTLLARTGQPEDIADAVLFLARAGYITGQILAVDGGRSLHS